MPGVKLNYFVVSILIHLILLCGGGLLWAKNNVAAKDNLKPSKIVMSLVSMQPKPVVTEHPTIIPEPPQPKPPLPQQEQKPEPKPINKKIIPAKKIPPEKIKPEPVAEQITETSEPSERTESIPANLYAEKLSAEYNAPFTANVENNDNSTFEVQFGADDGPSFKNKINPVYPSRALRAGKEAQVTLKLTIDSNGKLIKTEVVESGGKDFDAAAIQAIEKSSFIAAQRLGKPVTSIGLLKITFVIKK